MTKKGAIICLVVAAITIILGYAINDLTIPVALMIGMMIGIVGREIKIRL